MWAKLHEDLLEQIALRLTHVDVIQFGLVCNSWLSFMVEEYTRLPLQLPLSFCFPQPKLNPLLLHPSKDGSEFGTFWSIRDKRSTGHLSMPETHGKWACSSSHGWILMIDFNAPEEVILFNPINRAQIQLPPLSKFPLHQYHDPKAYDTPCQFYFISKAILTADPSKDKKNWILMVIASNTRRLCFYKPGDDNWSLVGSDPTDFRFEEAHIEDLLYHKEQFYAVHREGQLSTIVGSVGCTEKLKFKRLAEAPPPFWSDSRNYLVVSSGGELIQFMRFVEFEETDDYVSPHHTDVILAYKLDSSKNEWEELESLCDDIFFLGAGASMCFSRREFPQLKANCIYLTDDRFRPVNQDYNHVECLDSGVFDYGDEILQPFDDSVDPFVLMRSLWITPNVLQY